MPLIKVSIKFEEISFRFEEKGPVNLSNINLDLKAGQFIAIVGQSGSGNQL